MSTLPGSVRLEVSSALTRLGRTGGIVGHAAVAGGCINHGARVDTGSGPFFLKWNAATPDGMFEAEADGLEALRDPGTLRVPEPLAHGTGDGSTGWLLMEYIPAGRPGPGYAEALGRGLARLHRWPATDTGYGLERDNWIGSLPQENEPTASWSAFWREERIRPQLELAREQGYLSRHHELMDRLLDAIPTALADVDDIGPHLLHGDLWGGNAYAGPNGEPVLIDPAVYRGHGEVDLAMTELFGGFGSRFYDAYAEEGGISQAYDVYRRDLYQLYYLLVHVNLFGVSYEAGSAAAARNVVQALG